MTAGPAAAPPPCGVVDSLLAVRGLPRPFAMKGRATFDVEQYRVRGRFELRVDQAGVAVLEFSGATLLGGHREEIVLSVSDDTLRVLDRERGRFYEGDEVERMIREETRVPGRWTRALLRVLGDAGVCPARDLRSGPEGLEGTGPDGPFRLRWREGRLARAEWPDPAPGDTFDDRLEVDYDWAAQGLARLEARLPGRGWRVRLDAD